MIEIQYADDIIDTVLIHGYARIGRGLYRCKQLVPIVVNVQSHNIDACGHDLVRHDIGKFYRRLNKLGAILVENILVLGSLDN